MQGFTAPPLQPTNSFFSSPLLPAGGVTGQEDDEEEDEPDTAGEEDEEEEAEDDGDDGDGDDESEVEEDGDDNKAGTVAGALMAGAKRAKSLPPAKKKVKVKVSHSHRARRTTSLPCVTHACNRSVCCAASTMKAKAILSILSIGSTRSALG